MRAPQDARKRSPSASVGRRPAPPPRHCVHLRAPKCRLGAAALQSEDAPEAAAHEDGLKVQHSAPPGPHERPAQPIKAPRLAERRHGADSPQLIFINFFIIIIIFFFVK